MRAAYRAGSISREQAKEAFAHIRAMLAQASQSGSTVRASQTPQQHPASTQDASLAQTPQTPHTACAVSSSAADMQEFLAQLQSIALPPTEEVQRIPTPSDTSSPAIEAQVTPVVSATSQSPRVVPEATYHAARLDAIRESRRRKLVCCHNCERKQVASRNLDCITPSSVLRAQGMPMLDFQLDLD